MSRPLRSALVVALLIYLVVAATLVLSPTPGVANSGIVGLMTQSSRLGYDLPFRTAEFGLNVLLVVPFSLLAGLILPRIKPTVWVAAVFVASLTVEFGQLVVLPGRTGSSRDVVANALGALLGLLILLAINRPGRSTSTSGPSILSSSPVRAGLVAAYVVYLAAVAYLVWFPSPSAPGRSIRLVVDLALSVGVVISDSGAERGLNVLMLVPLSLIGGLLVRRISIADWLVIGFLLSLTVELVQRLALPTRSGSSRDIVANTAGALVGAIFLTVLIAMVDHRSTSSPRRAEERPTSDAGTMQG